MRASIGKVWFVLERRNCMLIVALVLTALFLNIWTAHFWNATWVFSASMLAVPFWHFDIVANRGKSPVTRPLLAPRHLQTKWAGMRLPHRGRRRVTGAPLALVTWGLAMGLFPNPALPDQPVRVANLAELGRALDGGAQEILLANGAYGDLSIEGRTFDPPVIIRSEVGREARFTSIAILATQGIRIESVHVDNPLNGTRTGALVLVSDGSRDVVFRDSRVNARVDDIFSGFVALQSDKGAQDVTFADNMLHDVRRGGLFINTTGLVVRGNTVDRISEDSFKFIAVHDVLIENNTGARLVYPDPGAHLDFIQFQGADSSRITIRGNVSLPGNAAAATAQGIFLDDAHYSDVLIERNIIVTGMIRGVSLSSGTRVVARYNTVLDVEGIGSKATLVIVDGQVYGNIMGSYPNDKTIGAGRNLVLQKSALGRPWHYDRVFANADRGIGITLKDLRPVENQLVNSYGATAAGAD